MKSSVLCVIKRLQIVSYSTTSGDSNTLENEEIVIS